MVYNSGHLFNLKLMSRSFPPEGKNNVVHFQLNLHFCAKRGVEFGTRKKERKIDVFLWDPHYKIVPLYVQGSQHRDHWPIL